jgi:hypothetical protein
MSLAAPALAQAPQTLDHAAPLCPAPPAPPPESLRPARVNSKPALPACAATQRCRKAEVDRYNSQIDAFNADIETWNRTSRLYVDALNRWQQAVEDYSRCEIDSMNAAMPHN